MGLHTTTSTHVIILFTKIHLQRKKRKGSLISHSKGDFCLQINDAATGQHSYLQSLYGTDPCMHCANLSIV
jgi:hypothetical protein